MIILFNIILKSLCPIKAKPVINLEVDIYFLQICRIVSYRPILQCLMCYIKFDVCLQCEII